MPNFQMYIKPGLNLINKARVILQFVLVLPKSPKVSLIMKSVFIPLVRFILLYILCFNLCAYLSGGEIKRILW